MMQTRHFFPLLALACLAPALAAPARASVLILSNGDRLTGHLIRRADHKVYFHSDVLGDLVAPENAVTIVDKPASRPSTNAMVGLPPQGSSPATAAAAAAPAAKPGSRPPVILTAPSGPWSGKVEVGYDNSVSGDIRTVAMNLRAEAERNVRAENFVIKGKFLYGSTGGVAATDEENADFRWRHNLTDRFFTQADTSYESDKIKLIHYQVEQAAGVGYKVFQSSRQTVDMGTGLTGEQLDATGVQKGFTYLGNVFQDYVYKINGRYTIREDASADYSPESRGLSGLVPDTITQATGDQRDYDYKFHTTLEGKISSHMSLNLHFEYQYDNAIVVPSSRAEQRVTTTLGYGF
jgi:putative salt-induced outer membrane protein YdiY